MMIDNNYNGSPLEACDYALDILGNKGTCRINGGGFAGSIICIVPKNSVSNFITKMGLKYGTQNVRKVSIRKTGFYIKKYNQL